MIEFLELAEIINKQWEEKGFCRNSFSNIAYEELSNLSLEVDLNQLEDYVANLALEKKLPKQLNVYNNFGQPPVTLFNNGQFVVDLYFWQNIDTSIHSHSFSGAFKVISGRSFHELFEMKEINVYSPDVIRTNLKLINKELLETGSTRKIVAGNSFNHRVVHLDNPTVTLCVRTINDSDKGQWHHFSNGLSIEKRSIDEEEIKALFILEYLLDRGKDSAHSYLNELISKWDISLTMNIFEQLLNDGMGLKEDVSNFLVEFISNRYSSEEWFQVYEEYYALMEEYITLGYDSPEARFIEVAMNSCYPLEESLLILKQIQGRDADQEQIEQLSAKL